MPDYHAAKKAVADAARPYIKNPIGDQRAEELGSAIVAQLVEYPEQDPLNTARGLIDYRCAEFGMLVDGADRPTMAALCATAWTSAKPEPG